MAKVAKIIWAGIALGHGRGERAKYQSNGFLARIGKVSPPKAVSRFLLKKNTGKIKQSFSLAGNRNTNGSFNNRGTNGNFWSSTQNDATNAWNRNLNSDNATVNRNNNNKANGFSVRCLKDWY